MFKPSFNVTPVNHPLLFLIFGLAAAVAMKPLLEEKQKVLRQKLEEKLWSAACWRDYQLSCVQRTYDTEIEQIEKEFDQERAQLKEKLIGDLLEHRRRLIEARDRLDNGKGGASPDCKCLLFLCLDLFFCVVSVSTVNDSKQGAASNLAAGGKRLRSKRGAEATESRNYPPGLSIPTGKRRQQIGVNNINRPSFDNLLISVVYV